jgi:uridine kinase
VLTVDLLVERIEELRRNGPEPVLVALDGRSGAGKSTLAAAVGTRTSALVIDGDDLYSGGNDEYWDVLDARHKMDLVIDWRRERAVLERLRRGRPATWRPYDWDADNGYVGHEIRAGPVGIVILDGAYSSRPELADLFTVR